MGKSLIIKGADFSANGISEELDITSLISDDFQAQKALNSFYGAVTANTKRCCIKPTTFASLGIDISEYSYIKVTVKSGYDYVFGTGVAPASSTGWQGWNGSTGGKTFEWVTTNQVATATVGQTTLSMCLNLRYDDNTTEFSSSAVITDIVESIILIP